MGSNQIKDNRKEVKGGIFIQLQKTDFVSNEVIEGNLHINLEEPYRGHLLVIQIDGIEETRFDYQVVQKNKKKENKKARGIKKFLSLNMPIYDFATTEKSDSFILMPGQWTIPFQIRIAEKLPSSIQYFKSITHNCSIQYTLSSYILPTNLDYRPVQGVQKIYICQHLPKQKEVMRKQIENSPLFSCCLSAGSYSITCTLNQQSYAPTEIINMSIECDLKKFKKKLDKLRIELIENITMTANTGFVQNKERFVVSKTELQIDDQLLQASIAVPSTITCSAIGTIIEIAYQIIITPLLDLSCLKANEPLIVPINIIPSKKMDKSISIEYPQLNQVKTPDNWNPKVLKQKEYSEQQSLKIQQLYIEFQEQQTQLVFHNINSQFEKFEKPIMGDPALYQ